MIFMIPMWSWFPMPRLKNGSAWGSLIRFATTWFTSAMSWRPHMPLRSLSGTVSHRSNRVDLFFWGWPLMLIPWIYNDRYISYNFNHGHGIKVIPIVLGKLVMHMFAWFIDFSPGNCWIAMSGHGVWDMLTTPFPIDPEAAWMTSRLSLIHIWRCRRRG